MPPLDPSPPDRETTLLEARSLSKSFGGVQAVVDLNLTVRSQQITGLIGPNGAGKSTLFQLLSRFSQPDRGDILFQGRSLLPYGPHQLAPLGLVRTFQTPRVFARLTVLDNVMVAAQGQRGERFWQVWLGAGAIAQQERQLRERAEAILESVGLGEKRRDYAGALSGGQRKLLGLAQVLMVQPQLVLLDEPAAGVNPTLVQQVCGAIAAWHREGIGFLIIEHNMDVIMGLCDRVWVMAEGRNLAVGSPEQVRQDPQVLEAYLGIA